MLIPERQNGWTAGTYQNLQKNSQLCASLDGFRDGHKVVQPASATSNLAPEEEEATAGEPIGAAPDILDGAKSLCHEHYNFPRLALFSFDDAFTY